MRRLWSACQQSEFIRWQLRFVLESVEAENCAVLLLDDAGEHLVFACSVGLHAEKYTGNGDYDSALRVPISGGIGLNAIAVLYGKPICMNEDDPRHNPAIDEHVGTKTRNLYAVPLAAREQTLGTFGTINAHIAAGGDKGFEPQDIAACHAATQAVSLWIEQQWEALLRDPQVLQTA